MGQVILTTASTSPWAVPSIFSLANHKVTLVGSGGNGGVGTTGTSGTSGGGGGGGACTVLTYSSGTITPGSTTIAFLINAGGSANATQWQSSSAGSGAYYEAQQGGTGAAAGTAGSASGSTTTVGTPTITYTAANHTGPAGGAGGGVNTLGAGGGAGSGGPAANGGGGGTPTSTGGGGGGGGGAANAGGSPSTATGGTGGNGSTGAGGGQSANGTGSSGGGGGPGANTTSAGGLGGSGGDFKPPAVAGCGGGGGASGRVTAAGAPTTNTGGNGGAFGGGGGGAAASRTAGGTLTAGTGGSGVISVLFTSIGVDWEVNLPTPLTPWSVKVRSQKGAAATTEDRDDGNYLPIVPPVQPARLIDFRTDVRGRKPTYSALKSRSEFAYNNTWQNLGFEEVSSQEPRRRWEKSAAAWMRGPDGTDAPFVNWYNFGWEPNLPAPLTPYSTKTRSQVGGAVMRGDDGNEAPFVRWFNVGWEQTYSQPPHRWWRGHTLRGIDGTDFPFVSWRNWFEQSYTQPVHRWLKSPDVGDSGIEAQFVTPITAVTSPWFDELNQLWRWPVRMRTMSALGHKVSVGFAPAPPTWDFQQTYTQPVHRWMKSPDIGDSGIEAKFVPPLPPTALTLFESTEQTWFWPKRFRAMSALRHRSGFSFNTNWYNVGWEQVQTQPLHRFFKSPDIGDSGIEAQFVFVPITFPSWWETPQPQPPRNRWERRGVYLRGDDGTEAPYVNWRNFGWEQTHTQPLHRLFKSPDVGDSGIENVYVFVPPGVVTIPWFDSETNPFARWPIRFREISAIGHKISVGFAPAPPTWDFQQIYTQPPRNRWERRGAYLRGDDGTEYPFVQWLNWFDQTYAQPPHRWFRGHGLRGDDGTNAHFVNWINIGWEQTQTQPLHRFFKSPDTGDQGIESPFVFTPPGFLAWGYEQVSTQPLHRWLKSPEFGDQGIQAPFINWINLGWDQVATQPLHKIWKSPDVGDTGIEAPFVFVSPVFTTWWEAQVPQPPHKRWTAGIMRGDDGNQGPFVNWRNFGWGAQEWQPPRRYWERRGAILIGDTGTENRYQLWRNWGWEIQHPQPPRRPWERRGAILRGDDGTQGRLVRWLNAGWEFNFPLVRHRIYYHPPIGDFGIEFPFRPPFVPPVTPPAFIRRPSNKVFIIDAVQGYYFGPNPNLNESCQMIIYVGGGMSIIPSTVLITFQRPDGSLTTGDPNFAYIGAPTIVQNRIQSFPAGQYVAYTFGLGELNQRGTWRVSFITSGFFSNSYSFAVV